VEAEGKVLGGVTAVVVAWAEGGGGAVAELGFLEMCMQNYCATTGWRRVKCPLIFIDGMFVTVWSIREQNDFGRKFGVSVPGRCGELMKRWYGAFCVDGRW